MCNYFQQALNCICNPQIGNDWVNDEKAFSLTGLLKISHLLYNFSDNYFPTYFVDSLIISLDSNLKYFRTLLRFGPCDNMSFCGDLVMFAKVR